MRNRHNDHPDPEELIRYSNGELSPRESARIARHLDNCWECRTEAEDTTSVISRYIHYRRNVLHPSIPAPPKDWQDLTRGFAQIRSEHQSSPSPWPLRMASFLRRPRFAVTALGAVIVTAALLIYLPKSQSAQAAELIGRAVRLEQTVSRKVEMELLRVQSREGEFFRRADLSATSSRYTIAASDVGTANRLEKRFQSAQYNWLKPLSAASFSEWRNRLADKQDAVSVRRDENAQDLVAVQTSTAVGALGDVTLVLRKSDLHPVRCEFHFRDGDEVEISEAAVPAQTASSPQPKRFTKDVRPTEPLSPAQSSTEIRSDVRLNSSDELRVLAALHRIGADLNDSLTIVRENSRIVVSGLGIKRERQVEIAEALRALPHVAIDFSEPQRRQVTIRPGEALTERPGPLAFGRRIEEQLGGPDAMETFSNGLLRTTETLLIRAHALRQLAERFPGSVEQQFGPADRQLLEQVRQDYGAELTRAADQIQGSLGPLLASLGVSVRAPQGRTSDSWQAAAQTVLAAGQRFDRILSATLAPTAGVQDESAELGNALSALQSAVISLRAERR